MSRPRCLLADKTQVKKLGEIIEQAREAAGLSREELAQRAEISREYIWMVERGKKAPTVPVFLRIAKGLGLRGSTLLARVERASGASEEAS